MSENVRFWTILILRNETKIAQNPLGVWWCINQQLLLQMVRFQVLSSEPLTLKKNRFRSPARLSLTSGEQSGYVMMASRSQGSTNKAITRRGQGRNPQLQEGSDMLRWHI